MKSIVAWFHIRSCHRSDTGRYSLSVLKSSNLSLQPPFTLVIKKKKSVLRIFYAKSTTNMSLKLVLLLFHQVNTIHSPSGWTDFRRAPPYHAHFRLPTSARPPSAGHSVQRIFWACRLLALRGSSSDQVCATVSFFVPATYFFTLIYFLLKDNCFT